MNTSKQYNTKAIKAPTYTKLGDYIMLVKLRLSISVVFTSVLGYLIVAGSLANVTAIALLALGGLLTTFSANAINEVLEKDFDKLMARTADRPLAAGRMKTTEAVLFAGLSCLVGVGILCLFNPIAGVLGMLSFLMYAFVYTPLKRYNTIAVAVGAVPGALPVLIGCSAFEGHISIFAFCLFMIQFLWQFPHFWSIGFLGFEDYKNAGYKLLPVKDDKIDRNLGFYSGIYSILILPIMLYLYNIDIIGIYELIIGVVVTIIYTILSFNFHRKFDRKSALVLMFGSFFFMPIVLLTYLFL